LDFAAGQDLYWKPWHVQAFWVLGAIALLALPAIFALIRRDELSDAVTKTTIREPQPAPAAAN
jgi:hypothetical protein